MIRRLLLPLVVASLCVFQVLGWFGHVHPAFDSFAHFRVHGWVLLALAVLLAGMKRRWNATLLALPFLLISAGLTWPYLKSSEVSAAAAHGQTIKVLQFNLYFANSDLAKAHALLSQIDADVVLLQEATTRTQGVLETLKASHPFQIHCRIVGVAIASRHPFSEQKKPECSPDFGFATALAVIDGHPVNLASVHLSWPWPRGQSRQVKMLAADFRELKRNVIIAGDFNAVPWSHTVKRIARLTSGIVAPGYQPSWGPSDLGRLREYVGLPIDNTIHSKGFEVISRRALADAGSDHLPIMTTIKLTEE